MKFSIVIPTYEMHGFGNMFLMDGLKSILEQEYKNYEVIVSDHSVNDDVEILTHQVLAGTDYTYLRNPYKRGNPSANLNYAIGHSTGKIIKPLFQDEYFCNPKALGYFAQELKNGAQWVAGARLEQGQYVLPIFTQAIKNGRNKLSSPSCIAYKACGLKWDECLIWMLDCDFYYRMYQKFGRPKILLPPVVFIRRHKFQLTHTLSKDEKQKEQAEMNRRYGY